MPREFDAVLVAVLIPRPQGIEGGITMDEVVAALQDENIRLAYACDYTTIARMSDPKYARELGQSIGMAHQRYLVKKAAEA